MPGARELLTSRRQWRLWLSGLIGSRYDGLDHFQVVEPGTLLRCGQPHVRDLDRLHAEYAFRTIVCARGGTRHPWRGHWFRRERAWCAAHAVKLEHMPFSDGATPPADVFARFLALIDDPTARPVLVHCEQGFHRTGILCAAFRIRNCGWTLTQALTEMRACGFDFERPKRRALLDALCTWAEAAGPATHPG
jgi:protein tyrosine/serine phosphatase